MDSIPVTALSMAERFIGIKEAPGAADNAAVLAMLQLDAKWVRHDDVPWCSAFANYIAWLLNLPRSKSLAARSWLTVGKSVGLFAAKPGFDVVIFSRGSGSQPGPQVLDAPGHVAFFAARSPGMVRVVGGNQSDAVTTDLYPADRVLGVRRLWGDE